MSSVDFNSIAAQPRQMLRKTEAFIRKGYHRALLAFHGLEEHFEGKNEADGSLLNRLTKHERRARLLEVRHAVNSALVNSVSSEEAGERILSGICAGLSWEFAALWKLDTTGSGRLRCAASWYSPLLPELVEFEVETLRRRFRKGVGVPGRVWEKRKPLWIRELARAREFPRTRAAAARGMRSALAFPIFIPTAGKEDRLFGVMEFFSRRPSMPDEELLEVTGRLGEQIGQFLRRLGALEALMDVEKAMGQSIPELLVAARARVKKTRGKARPRRRAKIKNQRP